MTIEAVLAAKTLLGDTQQLTGELSRSVEDIIISNAARISSFSTRRAELVRIEAEHLFYYAFALVLFSRTIQLSWNDDDVEPVLEAAADELSRQIAYSSAGQIDVKQIRAGVLDNARGMYKATKEHFGQALDGKAAPETIFEIVTLNLVQAFPGTTSLLMAEPALFSEIAQQFGTLSLTAVAGTSQREAPSRSGGFLRNLFSRR